MGVITAFVLVFLYCGVSFASEAGTGMVYLLCKSETGKLEVITTTPDKVMCELENLKNSTSGNYTVIVGDDTTAAGYYVISIGDEPAGAGAVPAKDGKGKLLLGGNNPVRWFERMPTLICAEIATMVMLVTLGWYYKRRKL